MTTTTLATAFAIALSALACGKDADSPKSQTFDGDPSKNGYVPSNGTMGPGGSMNNGNGPAGTQTTDPAMGGNAAGSSASMGASGGPMGNSTVTTGGAIGRDAGHFGK